MSSHTTPVFFVMVAVFFYASSACDFYANVDCASNQNKLKQCSVTGASTLLDVKLLQQESNAVCEEEVSFGVAGSKLWVKAGCRGKFSVCSCKHHHSMDCDSNANAYAECRVPGAKAVSSVRVTKQKSSSACTLNESFGPTHGSVWVNKGCRAKFQVCYK